MNSISTHNLKGDLVWPINVVVVYVHMTNMSEKNLLEWLTTTNKQPCSQGNSSKSRNIKTDLEFH
jgi:hypothetical protein